MRPSHILLALFIAFLWGLNFVAAKAAVDYFPPFFLLFMRLALVVLILLPFLRHIQVPMMRLFWISFTFVVLHFGMMFASLYYGLDVSVAAVLDQLRVPFALILGYFWLNERVNKRAAFGLMVAIFGAIIIFGSPTVHSNPLAFWLFVVATIAWAVYVIQVKNIDQPHVLSFIGWVSLFGMPQMLLLSILTEDNQMMLLMNVDWIPVVSLLYMVFAATIIAHGGWYYLLRKYPVNQVLPYSLLTPFFGVAMSHLLLDETLTVSFIMGGILTIVGVALIVVKKKNNMKDTLC